VEKFGGKMLFSSISSKIGRNNKFISDCEQTKIVMEEAVFLEFLVSFLKEQFRSLDLARITLLYLERRLWDVPSGRSASQWRYSSAFRNWNYYLKENSKTSFIDALFWEKNCGCPEHDYFHSTTDALWIQRKRDVAHIAVNVNDEPAIREYLIANGFIASRLHILK
jgi:hypothetical protein